MGIAKTYGLPISKYSYIFNGLSNLFVGNIGEGIFQEISRGFRFPWMKMLERFL
jgi:hypothetical protein